MMREQIHMVNVVKTDDVSTIDVHTYDGDRALLDVFGVTEKYENANIEVWITEDQVRALRDALNTMLGEP